MNTPSISSTRSRIDLANNVCLFDWFNFLVSHMSNKRKRDDRDPSSDSSGDEGDEDAAGRSKGCQGVEELHNYCTIGVNVRYSVVTIRKDGQEAWNGWIFHNDDLLRIVLEYLGPRVTYLLVCASACDIDHADRGLETELLEYSDNYRDILVGGIDVLLKSAGYDATLEEWFVNAPLGRLGVSLAANDSIAVFQEMLLANESSDALEEEFCAANYPDTVSLSDARLCTIFTDINAIVQNRHCENKHHSILRLVS